MYIVQTAAWRVRGLSQMHVSPSAKGMENTLVPAHGHRCGLSVRSSGADAKSAEQVSAAVNPANEGSQSFQECVLIRHPRHGEFAFGFITGSTSLQARAHAALLMRVERRRCECALPSMSILIYMASSCASSCRPACESSFNLYII